MPFASSHVDLRVIIKSRCNECIIYNFRQDTGRKCLILLNIPAYFTSFVWVSNVKLRSKIAPRYFVFSLYLSTFVPIFSPLSKFGGKVLFSGLKIQQLDFFGSKFIVSLFAFIHFCSLFSSTSTNPSN